MTIALVERGGCAKKEGVPNPCGSHPVESYAGAHLQFRADPRRRLGKRILIGMAIRSPFALPGLWERWKNPKGAEVVLTFTILTTTPNELCSAIHNCRCRLASRIFQPCYCASECPDLESAVTGSAIRGFGFIKIPVRFGTTSPG